MSAKITISIGADHGGYLLRRALLESLQKWNIECIDHGTDSSESVDYPDYGLAVGNDVAKGKADLGVLICTTGIGMCISANKVHGVRAANAINEDAAEYAKKHNNANVICFGGKYDTPYLAEKMLKKFIETPFEGGRHQRRIDKINAEEQS